MSDIKHGRIKIHSAVRIFFSVLLVVFLFFIVAEKNKFFLMFSTPVPNAQNFVTGVLPGDLKSPTIRQVEIKIKPRAYYLIQAHISGAPETHFDIMSYEIPGYDNPAQELVITRSPHGGNYFFLFNSGDAPENVWFRVHFLDAQPVELLYVNLTHTPVWAVYAWRIIVVITALGACWLILGGLSQKKFQTAFVIFMMGFGLALSIKGHPLGSDNRNYAMVARSLISDGDIKLNEFEDRIRKDNFYGITQDDGNLYNIFPLGPSLALAPLYAAIHFSLTINADAAENLAGKLAVAIFFGGTLSLFFLLVSRFEGVDLSRALALTLIFGFCSHQLSQHVAQFWSHNAVMPVVLATFLALTSARQYTVSSAGIFLVGAYVMRPTAGLLAPMTGIWLWRYRKDCFWPFVGAGIAAGILLVGMNLLFYGQVIPPYNQASRLGSPTFFEAIAGNLISPNRGLLVFMPWAVFSMIGAWWAFFHKEVDPFFRLMAVIAGAHFVVVSSFPHWWAGWSYGPRFLAEIMPELTLLLIPFFQTPLWTPKAIKLIFAATIIYAFAVQLSGLTAAAGVWNALPVSIDEQPERIWDWHDLQILSPVTRS